RQRWDVEELSTIPQLATTYAKALIRAHTFVDGNKRSGFLVAVVFLGLNGFHFQASNEEVVLMICRLAAGELPWTDLQAWFETNSTGPT
ncbi:MAG: type II toxin-antitoxin system death-on-curing family toxin, partial [Cyanobacteria bacterium K_DeepCast_150m_m2_101]|nr:type II toxin-antitoxin system death-on-curing family toxin [Cyanobacteria bacterium K_DeepCast_150m_m2_101]